MLTDGSYGIIETVKAIRYDEPETTYNFEVEDFHTYYVGTGVLVHNKGCGYHSETIFEHENIGHYKDVSMHLERGGSGKVNLHIHGAGDKFIFNGSTYISNAGKVIPKVISGSQTVSTGFNRALSFASKMGWLFP